MDQLATGMGDVQRGFAVLRAHPALWKYIIAPAVVTLVVLGGLVFGALHVIDPAVAWTSAHVPSWAAGIVGSLLRVALTIALGAGALILFVPIAGAIAGPFNEMLSEHVEQALTGRPSAPFAFGAFVTELVVGIGHSVRRVLASLGGLVIVFVVGLVPVIGAIAAFGLAAWLTATGAAYDCYDAVLARRAMPYRDKLQFLARHRARSLGLGGAVTVMLLIPVLNLASLGIGAAGATVAVLAIEGKYPLPARRVVAPR